MLQRKVGTSTFVVVWVVAKSVSPTVKARWELWLWVCNTMPFMGGGFCRRDAATRRRDAPFQRAQFHVQQLAILFVWFILICNVFPYNRWTNTLKRKSLQ